jgi:hypothetical protein
MLNVFLRLKQEQPALFAQAALKPTAQPSSTALSYAAQQARGERPYGAGPFTGQLGPFASEEDAAAACRVLEAADIQCVGRPEGK